ncbi:hypothetical protein BGZ58_000210 [Dissophora ornata]|nr:hypothetical protein BGZ58_000210 [Dissophora ornata]
MQAPASSSIQSPRPQGRPPAQPQVPFDKELMASLHVLLNQLNEVERQGLVMFHKIEESFKHPYSQQEAIGDTANLLKQLDTLSTQAKTTGFGALTMLPTSPTVASTPSASSFVAGTPKPTFMSPRMQNHIHNNLHTHPNNNINNTDVQMLSPTPLSLVGTPAFAVPAAAVGGPPGSTATSATGTSGSVAPTPTPGSGSAVATPGANINNNIATGNNPAISPFPSSDTIMSSSTPAASGINALDSAMTPALTSMTTPTGTGAGAATGAITDPAGSTPMMMNPTTPATPSANLSTNPSGMAMAQMMDARQKDVNVLYAEKRRLKQYLSIAAKMSKS